MQIGGEGLSSRLIKLSSCVLLMGGTCVASELPSGYCTPRFAANSTKDF